QQRATKHAARARVTRALSSRPSLAHKTARAKSTAPPQSAKGAPQSEDHHEDQRRNASALPAGANESERASEHDDRPNGGNRPYRQRYDFSQGCCPFPNAIEHEPPLREQYGLRGRRWPPPPPSVRPMRPRALARSARFAHARSRPQARSQFAECVPRIQRENSSWLSLATRSNASFAFLMRYW